MSRFLASLFFFVFLTRAQLEVEVRDLQNRPVSGAAVEVRSQSGVVLASGKADVGGRYSGTMHCQVPCVVRVSGKGFASREVIFTGNVLQIALEPSSLYTKLTVTAMRGTAEEAVEATQVTSILDREDMTKKPLVTLGNALEGTPGVLVQQTTTAQVSPFLRGLTGYQVLNLVDGLRFNNSTFRSGPNQYLAFIEPSQAQRVEAMLGPTGVQYGSDSLGGTIHVSTEAPQFTDSGWQRHGTLSLSGASADLSGGANGRISISNDRWFYLLGASGRKHNDLRAGGGVDSRHVYRRLFGMSNEAVRDLVGSRQQDTGFSQYGVETKIAARLTPTQLLTFNYQRGEQSNVRGYKDLMGGLGRLISDFTPQTLNWLYGRYEKLTLGPLDSVSGTFVWNQQTDGSRRQNLLATDAITTDLSTVNVYGYTGQATTHWGSRAVLSFGGDIYDEHIDSTREVRNPVTGTTTRPRALYPRGARYANFGTFAQGSMQLLPKLRAAGGIRWTGVRFADTSNTLWFRDTTFHASLRWDLTGVLGLHAVASRGFRAPNLNDLGALGLNDLGYEIPAAEAIPGGALLSTDSGESATSKGQPLRNLGAESLMNYEFGVRLNARKLLARVQGFHAELSDPIVRRTLLFPTGNVPAALAGLPVSALPQTAAQRNQGVVMVATALDPRAVKAFVNDGAARYYGVEALTRYRIASHLGLEANYTFLVGRDLYPNRNIRRLPPQSGTITIRHTPGGRRPWLEVAGTLTGAQRRLSGGDLDDERIGASFRRSDIAAFFRGSRVSTLVDANGVFRPTGETLLQIQNRVLPGLADSVRVPLYTSTTGWMTVAVRSGMAIGERWQLMAALENLTDRNYRTHGSGMDAPGIQACLNLSYRF